MGSRASHSPLTSALTRSNNRSCIATTTQCGSGSWQLARTPVFQRCRASVQRAHRPMLRATKVRPFLLTITGLRHDGPRHTSLHWTSNACRTQYDQHTQAHSTRDEAQRFTHTTSDRRKHCPVDQSRGLLQRPKRQHGRHVGLSATSHHSQLRLPYAGISPKLSVRRTRFMTDVSCAWAQRLVISPAGM